MFTEINREKSKHEGKIILGYMMTGIAFVLYLPLASSIGIGAFFLVGVPFLGGAFYASHYQKKIKLLSNNFKAKYVTEEVKKVFPNSTYRYDLGFTENEVIESNLLLKRDRFKSEDLIQGLYDGVSFKCSDLEQKEVRGSGKDRRVVTVFQGRFYEFDFHKNFKHNLILLQPNMYRPFSGLNKVDTESIHFNSEFKIFAESDHEAFYILTPDFMEKLIYFDRKYLDKISFSFKNNKLYIAIDTRKDYFDIKPFKKVDMTIFNEYQEELKDIQELVKVLNLNSTLFK
ncbi:MAG: DUF3137 domain-containing protein [Candidatus Izemoplasmatales bacterium]